MARLRDRQQFEFPVGHGLSLQARLQDKPAARFPMSVLHYVNGAETILA